MKIHNYALALVGSLALVSCQWDGGPIINEDKEHKVNVGVPTEDSQPLAASVRKALKRNAQTMHERIKVSSQSADTVRLTGLVANAGAKAEAERVAGRVPGVRFVVNTLEIK